MESKVNAEIRRLRQDRFYRWVIIDDHTKPPRKRKFWNGERWVSGLRNAMLYAHKDVILDDLIAIHSGR